MIKQLLFLISLVFSFTVAYGQHIKFMGTEVTGDYENFKDSLELKGFTYIDSFETVHMFCGTFANERVTLNVMSSSKTNIVFKVIVYFPEREGWNELKRAYFAKKNLYKTKYNLVREFQFFSSPYKDGDGYEMYAVAKDKCKYISFFQAVGGLIAVEIDKSSKIKVVYEDRENIKIAESELKNKAIVDI